MSRLTNFDGDGFIACNGCFEPQCTNCKEFKTQASKLAEYENTRLEPHEILTGLELADVYATIHELKKLKAENTKLRELVGLAIGAKLERLRVRKMEIKQAKNILLSVIPSSMHNCEAVQYVLSRAEACEELLKHLHETKSDTLPHELQGTLNAF